VSDSFLNKVLLTKSWYSSGKWQKRTTERSNKRTSLGNKAFVSNGPEATPLPRPHFLVNITTTHSPSQHLQRGLRTLSLMSLPARIFAQRQTTCAVANNVANCSTIFRTVKTLKVSQFSAILNTLGFVTCEYRTFSLTKFASVMLVNYSQ
jgi:hypothetical protein